MPTAAPFTPPKKKRSVYWWLGGFALLLFLVFLYQLIGPSPRIIISKQTTYIDAPLLASGDPNYEAYLWHEERQGIPAENNAAVLLVQALWPANLESSQYSAVCRELQLPTLPSTDSALEPLKSEAVRKKLSDWLEQQDATYAELDVDAIVDAARRQGWTGEQLLPLAAWLDSNKKPLDLIVEASRRPRYYFPSPTYLNDRHDLLINVELPGAECLRDATRALQIRALRDGSDHDFDDAWNDIRAIYRISDLAAQGPASMEQMVARGIRGEGLKSALVLLGRDSLTPARSQQIKRDLDAIKPFANAIDCVNHADRLMLLDAMIHMHLYGADAFNDSSSGHDWPSPLNYTAIDTNVILRQINELFDQALAVMQIQDREERTRAIKELYATLDVNHESLNDHNRSVLAFFSRQTRSEMIGTIMKSLLFPAIDVAVDGEDDINTRLSLVRLSAAIAVYRTSNGRYPKQLEELLPHTISALPADIYRAKPFLYRLEDTGYLLYSAGRNGLDDGGSNKQDGIFKGQSLEDLPSDEAEPLLARIPAGADDISIRLPVPPFKLPTSPADETSESQGATIQ